MSAAAPQLKQYLYQAQDDLHYLRLSLTLAITNHLLVPQHELLGSTPSGALDLRLVASSAMANRGSGSPAATSAGAASSSSPQHQTVEVLGTLWSLHEDKLILRSEEARADVVSVYAAFHHANPVMYPKVHIDAAPFRARYAAVQDDPVRLKMVRLLPDDSVTHLESSAVDELSRRSSGLFQSGGAATGAMGVSVRTKAAALKAFQKRQPKQSHSGGAYRKEDLILAGVVRQGSEQQEIACCSEDITPQSPFLRDLFHRSNDYLPSGSRRVTLSEKDTMWTTIPDMCSVFAADNLQRFKNFCEAPSMLATLVDLNERLKYKESQATEEWNEFVTGMFGRRDEQLELVGALCASTTASLKTKLNAAMERDLDAVRELYAAHMQAEENKVKLYFDQQQTNIELFYEREIASLDALREAADAQEPESIGELRADLAALSELTADTYGHAHLPRLLMLSDVLMCNDLRSQCLKLMATELTKFASMPEMNSELLRANTLRELMTLVSDGEVQHVHRLVKSRGAAHRGISLPIVDAELAERGEARAQDLLRRELHDIQDLSRRVNLLVVKIKHQQAAAVATPVSSVTSPSSPRKSIAGGGSERALQAVKSAYNFVKSQQQHQPKTRDDLTRGVSDEDIYLGWRELLQDTLSRKLQQAGGPHNVAVLSVPRGLEGQCVLLPHRRGFDVKQCFKQITVEGQGCVTIGESHSLLYWEARVVFVDSGTRFPVNVLIGMDPVARSMNAVQLQQLKTLLVKENESTVSAHALSAERVARETSEANPFVGPTIAAISSAAAPAHALLRNLTALAQLNATCIGAVDRSVGVTPVNVSALSASSLSAAATTSDESQHHIAALANPVLIHGIAWGNDGVLYVDGVPFDIRATYDVGDTIGIAFHSMTGDVHLYKNEQRIHITDKTVPWPKLRVGIAYQPAISVFCSAVPTGSQPQAAALLHQSAPADEDTVVVSLSAAPPKARVLTELDGRCRVMPHGSIAFSKGAVPVVSMQRSNVAATQ